MPPVHELKTWPVYFNEVVAGKKTFEVRKNDRDFKLGDVLWLRCYDPSTHQYGNSVCVTVTYLLEGGQWGIEEGYVIMGFQSPYWVTSE